MVKTNCPFCKIGSRVIKENESAQAFLSNPRKVAGHFLVTPKRHVEKPWELSKKELKDIFELIFFIEKLILGKFGDGVDVKQNYRPFLKQGRLKIDHVHYHVIPRKLFDKIYEIEEKSSNELFEDLSDAEQRAVVNLFKQ
jgi:diadenosine tetraphosphate (Ap4A) HIT family hydrolase